MPIDKVHDEGVATGVVGVVSCASVLRLGA